MRLIGMLDSPYVRRVAVSLELLGVPFEHEALSVFSTFEQFQRINPVVKAPTLVCDNGEVLMDSSLILQFIEANITPGRSLWPTDALERQHDFRVLGLALAACDKSVQFVYERNLRPKSAQHEPWIERVTNQIRAAYAALEQEIKNRQIVFAAEQTQAAITSAVVWRFTQSVLAEIVRAEQHPSLVRLSYRLESTPAFRKYLPAGPGVPASN